MHLSIKESNYEIIVINVRMFIYFNVDNTKNDLIEAERTSVLNQMLFIVKNMVLFDFTEK
jgi:hypothetical protein